MTTRKATRLETEAATLFNVTVDRIPAVLWALDLRETCSRCLGSGHYSRNSFGSTTCYRCNGRRESAAKLTRPVLEQARVKVAAGELDAIRARARALKAAKAKVAPTVAAAEAIYGEISRAYDVAYKANVLRIDGAIFRAQTMNNALFWGERLHGHGRGRTPGAGVTDVAEAVETGRLDAIKACVLLDELLAMLAELRDAWRAWEASQRARLRAAARARLAA